jgi:hypothetical protein
VIERLAADGDVDGLRLVAGDFFSDTLPTADI